MNLAIRSATPGDAGLVFTFVRELAAYERLSHEVEASEADLVEALFGPSPRVFCEIADVDGEAAGLALWFYTFSTFRGRHGIYLEDLYVRPAYRRRGAARGLIARLAERCAAERLGRLEWAVLKWNAPAVSFYESLGAVAIDGWTVYRTDGAALARLGRSDDSALGGASTTGTGRK